MMKLKDWITQLNVTQKITLNLIIFFLFTSLIPVSILSLNSYNQARETADDVREQWMQEHISYLTETVSQRIEIKLDVFNSFLANGQISQLIELKATNLTLQEEFLNSSFDDQTTGDFYPQRLQQETNYQLVLEFFLNQAVIHDDLMMLRIFSSDGNVMVGVVDQQEDLIDNKGDKQWFQDTLLRPENSSTYISPISIARVTGTPTIRLTKPYYVNGTVEGLVVAAFTAEAIVDQIKKDDQHSTGFSAMIDLNYINAEGDELGEIYIAHSLEGQTDQNLTFNEENPGIVYFNTEFFATRDKLEIYQYSFNNTDVIVCFDIVTSSDQEWIVLHVIELAEYYASVDEVGRFNIILFLITISLAIIVGGFLGVIPIHISVRKEKEAQELRNLLPICSNCKKIRDDAGYWNQIEDFLHTHENLDFTHSLCESCLKKLYPDI